jgi:cytochrome c556
VEYERRLEETDIQARHALHDARLQELMRGIQRLSEDRLPKSLDVEGPLRFQAQEVAQIARVLSDSAMRIPEAGDGARMSPIDRAEFNALARELQEHAAALARAADALRADEARSQLEAIQQTCQGCHVRFRPLGSP